MDGKLITSRPFVRRRHCTHREGNLKLRWENSIALMAKACITRWRWRGRSATPYCRIMILGIYISTSDGSKARRRSLLLYRDKTCRKSGTNLMFNIEQLVEQIDTSICSRTRAGVCIRSKLVLIPFYTALCLLVGCKKGFSVCSPYRANGLTWYNLYTEWKSLYLCIYEYILSM